MNDNSGPAFPSEGGPYMRDGLSKREYYAGQAMMGLLASATTATAQEFARTSVICADALMAELSKSNESQKE